MGNDSYESRMCFGRTIAFCPRMQIEVMMRQDIRKYFETHKEKEICTEIFKEDALSENVWEFIDKVHERDLRTKLIPTVQKSPEPKPEIPRPNQIPTGVTITQDKVVIKSKPQRITPTSSAGTKK